MSSHASLTDTHTHLSLSIQTQALCHDLDHPGVTNGFLVRTSDPLALRYHFRSPLERHHAACGLALLEKHGVLSPLPPSERAELQTAFVAAVLATDMSRHAALVARLSSRVEAAKAAREGAAAAAAAGCAPHACGHVASASATLLLQQQQQPLPPLLQSARRTSVGAHAAPPPCAAAPAAGGAGCAASTAGPACPSSGVASPPRRRSSEGRAAAAAAALASASCAAPASHFHHHPPPPPAIDEDGEGWGSDEEEACGAANAAEAESAPGCAAPLADRRLLVSVLLHAADLHNALLPPALSRRVALTLEAEFGAQADAERAARLPVSVMLSSSPSAKARNELAFVQRVVRPLFEKLAELAPPLAACVARIDANEAAWRADAAEA